MRRVIYIVGLSHSGSTVLDMLLTTAGKAVGLGQVWTVLGEDLDHSRQRSCSCGAPATGCEVWGAVITRLAALPRDAAPTERYRIVIDVVDTVFGPGVAFIDSSKHAEYLAVLTRMPDLQVEVVHNIKDVRAFTVSTLDNAARKNLGKSLPEKIFYQWWRDNRVSYREAKRLLGRAPVRVMYEGLCLATEPSVSRLAQELGTDYIDTAVTLNEGHTHIIAGNRLRLSNTGKPKLLTYDYRWMMRSEWLRPYALMPMVRRYNEQALRELTGTA
jgi:hypothetical protein